MMLKLTKLSTIKKISICGITTKIISPLITHSKKQSLDRQRNNYVEQEQVDIIKFSTLWKPMIENNDQHMKNPINFKRSYPFSSVKQPYQEPQSKPQRTQKKQTPQSQQNVISVDVSRSKMLFIDSNKLSSIAKLNEIKRRIKGEQTSTKESIFAIKNNQTQLSSFTNLDKKILTLTKYNEYLSKGKFQQYSEYPIVKLLQICLKYLQLHHTTSHQQLYTCFKSPRQHWKSLQYFIRKRMHNCSSKDYMKIVYIVLNSYHSVYRFNNQFVQAIISGLKREVPLMEEQQLMQLFLVVSQPFMKERAEWESSLRFSQLTHTKEQIVKSPFFQNQYLTNLHDQILEKIVKRYQNKFMNTELFIKEEELFKLCWWLKITICFRNQSFGHIKNNEYSNLTKNKFIVGMVNVLSSKLHSTLKQNTISLKIKGQMRQIQSKATSFKSLTELIHFIECLSLARDYLNEEGKMGRICEGIDEKSKEVRLRADTWGEKSVEVNEIMRAVLDYQGVRDLIQERFIKNSTEENRKESIYDYQQKWQFIDLINEAEKFNHLYSPLDKSNTSFIDWQIQLINDFKVFELMQQTHQKISSHISKSTDSNNVISQNDKLKLIKLGQCQMNILYQLFDNMFSIKKHLQSFAGEKNQTEQILQHTNFSSIFTKILNSCFYHFVEEGEFLDGKNRINGMVELIYADTVLKMIHFQLGLLKLNSVSSSNDQKFTCLPLILSYTEEMLGFSPNTNNSFNFSYYIRELQFALYNYFTSYLTSSIVNPQSSFFIKAKQLSQTLFNRNSQAQEYLKEHNLQYQQMVSNENKNSFMTQKKFLAFSTNNYRALATNQVSKNSKHKLLEGGNDFGLNKEAVLLGEYIMKCINIEKKSLLQNQDIIKLNKFFTEIKAFNQVKFYSPITCFSVCPQFIVSLPYTNQANFQINDQSKRQLIKALMFLDKEQLMRVELLSKKEMYSVHGVQTVTIDMKEFFNLHINERIQLLNRLIFGSLNQQQNQQHKKLTNQEINSRIC